MSMVRRSASASWSGSIAGGKGTVAAASGAFGPLPISLATRVGEWKGETSAEELLAGAFGSCFVMAIAAEMTAVHKPPADLDVWVSCTEGEVDDGFAITGLSARIVAQAPGLERAELEQLVARALAGCPAARALRGNVPIQVDCEIAET